jgi:hypothetical protein
MLNSYTEERSGLSYEEYIISQGGKYSEVWDKGNVTMKISGISPKNTSIEKMRMSLYIGIILTLQKITPQI